MHNSTRCPPARRRVSKILRGGREGGDDVDVDQFAGDPALVVFNGLKTELAQLAHPNPAEVP